MNELYQRPANYWLRHADRYKESGDLIRAAVLQRHAVHAEPGSDDARMEYALTLHQMCCYEASNREAFRVLAMSPGQVDLYGLIGCNLIKMGLIKEGQDALNSYMQVELPATALWHDEACELAERYRAPIREKKRRARLHGLLSLAASHLASGELDGAGKALHRAQQQPFDSPDGQRDLLMAMYFLHRGHPDLSLLSMKTALENLYLDVPALTMSAVLCTRLGLRLPTRRYLLVAAEKTRTPADQQLMCQTADSLNTLFIAQGMLKRMLNRQPNRCPVLYDLCVCALKLGRLHQAARYIHLCREIDPDDVPSECLFARVMAWKQQNLPPDELRKAAQDISFYGSCTETELSACARPFLDAIENGAEIDPQDERLRRHLLFLLTLPLEWPLLMLRLMCARLPDRECEALLREVLMQHPAESAAKRYAMNVLRQMGAPAPYVCWTRDRFLLVDPEKLFAPVPTFRQRQLTRFIHRLSQTCGRQIVPWALETISRMTPAQQCHLIGDRHKIWPTAMAIQWSERSDGPIPGIPDLPPARLNALYHALGILNKLDQGGNNHADH